MSVTRTDSPEEKEALLSEARLVSLLGGRPESVIYSQEERGSREMVASEQIPVEGSDHPVLTEWGIVLGDAKQDDPLFRGVVIPSGWSFFRGNRYWSLLKDSQGKVRAKIFYKAASYDRRASISPCVRFDQSTDDAGCVYPACYGTVTDGGLEVWRTENSGNFSDVWKQTETWLDEHYPQWRDVRAYWGDR